MAAALAAVVAVAMAAVTVAMVATVVVSRCRLRGKREGRSAGERDEVLANKQKYPVGVKIAHLMATPACFFGLSCG